MFRSIHNIHRGGLSAFALCLAATFSHAASPTTQEVVVSATRSEQASFDVAAADTAVGVADSGKLGINLSDYVSGMAGIAARDRQNYAQDQQLSIRGFGARAQFGIVGVRLYVDGIPATMPDGQGQASHIDFAGAERIEVLRGPFSVLYGNAAGGVVQVFTARGDEQTEVRASTQGGSFDTWRSSAGARGSLHGVDYNVDYTHFNSDGWRDHSHAHRDLGNVRLDLDPSANNHLMVIFNRLSAPDAQDNGSLTQAQFAANPRQAAPTSLQFDTRKSLSQTQFGVSDEQRLGEVQSLHVMAYTGTRQVLQVLATPVGAQNSATSPGGVVDLHNRFSGGDAHWQLELPLNRHPLTVVAGVGYDSLRSARRGYNNFSGSTVGVVGTLRRDELNTLYNFDQYAQADWTLSPRWSVQAGVRRVEVHFESDDHFIASGNPDDSGNRRFSAWNPAASSLFRISDRLHLYAAYGRALDTPTFDNLAYRPDGGSGLNFALQAAHTDNYEFGAKWRGSTLASRIAIFRADTDNEIAVASSQGGRSTYRNVGRTRRQGIETELDWALGRVWRYQLAYTLLDARYRDNFMTCTATVCPVPNVPVARDNRLPAIARSTLYNALRWGAEIGWYAAAEATYLSRTPVDDLNSQSAGAYGLLGLNGGYLYDGRRWRGQFFARIDNVFDRTYAGAVVVNDANARFYQPGNGRGVYAGMNVAWRL